MLYTLFLLWAFAVAVPATLLTLILACQVAAGQIRRLTAARRATPEGAPAGA